MIDLNGDFSFDPLADGGGPLDQELAVDGAVDAENRAHAALFAHVGVSDPGDWRKVALRLACMYKPDLLNGFGPCEPPIRATGGRPRTRTDSHLMLVKVAVDAVMEWAHHDRIARKYRDARNACGYIVNPRNSDAEFFRDVLDLKPGTSARTLANKYSMAKKLAESAAIHRNA